MSSTPCPNVSCVPEDDYYYEENATEPENPTGIRVDVYLAGTLTRISLAFEVVSVALIIVVLALSVVQTTAKTSVGPKIFAVNLLGFNLLYCLSSLLSDLRMITYRFDGKSLIFDNPVFMYVEKTDCIRSLTLLVFNASYVPFLAMFILACLRPSKFNKKSTSLYYAGLVCLADAVPIALQVVNLITPSSVVAPGSSWNSWGTELYAYSTFTLYVLQVSLMIVSVWVVTVKSKELTLLQANPSQTAARRKELIKALYFAVGPCLIQLPIAIQLALRRFEKTLQATDMMAYYRFAELTVLISQWVRMSRAITPIVDALSILLFLGDYRRSARAVLRSIGRMIQESFPRSNSVEPMPAQGAQHAGAPWRQAPTSYGAPYFSQSHGSYAPRHTSA